MNRETLLKNGYREWEVDMFHKSANVMYQKRFRNGKGQTKYFITIYEYKKEDDFTQNYIVELQFEKDKYTMNIELFGIHKDMTLEDIETTVYVIWHRLNCKYYEE